MAKNGKTPSLPKMRAVDASPFTQNGEPALLLRDPLQLSGNYMVLPRELGPALMLLDGTMEMDAIRAALLVRYGMPVSADLLEHLITLLDENFMLENRRSDAAHLRSREIYRRAPFRTPALADQSYPADPTRLKTLFDGYLAQTNGKLPTPTTGKGVISPHIDYPRGGPVYAAVWKHAAEMANAADLIVLLGTDHYSIDDRITLTRQHYSTPFGVLPTHQGIVDSLAEAIGPEQAFAGELRNLGEHSLELVATWLHHMRGGRPVEMVPILTGSFVDMIVGKKNPAHDPTLNRFLRTLRKEIAGRNVLVVASGDLSHVGPAFGGMPLDASGKAGIKGADDELIGKLVEGNADGFYSAIRRIQDRNNVCGVAPFYLMLRLLGESEGILTSYDQCPADEHDTSLVSVCGMILS
ncbi:MAG: AmmeMemoRadiSam system protein B [Chloroflexota bacterium]|nr:AmmeMemoRadiSam system protein B [Chloroflexota bacterium]